MNNLDDVKRAFDHHPPKDEETRLMHEGVREAFKVIAITMTNLPQGRERSLVMTKLEEASFWAHAAVARPRG
jgi:hypothetical protein